MADRTGEDVLRLLGLDPGMWSAERDRHRDTWTVKTHKAGPSVLIDVLLFDNGPDTPWSMIGEALSFAWLTGHTGRGDVVLTRHLVSDPDLDPGPMVYRYTAEWVTGHTGCHP